MKSTVTVSSYANEQVAKLNVIWQFVKTYEAVSTKEVRNILLVNIVDETAETLIVVAAIDEELITCVVINEWTHEGPEHREDPWRTDDKKEAHCFRVVGLDDLDNAEESTDARTPEMPHAQTLEVDDARAIAEEIWQFFQSLEAKDLPVKYSRSVR